MKVGIIGPYPPPVGGISIHIKRLSYLLSQYNVPHVIFAKQFGASTLSPNDKVCWIGSQSEWLFSIRGANCDVLHVNTAFDYKMAGFFRLIFQGPLVFTVHGNELRWPYAVNCLRAPDASFKGRLATMVEIQAIKCASHVVCVNPGLRQLLISRGVPATKVSVIPAYLPPMPEEAAVPCSKRTPDFLTSHWPLISANAFQIAFYQGRDLYGLDTSIELCALLRQRYPRVGFLFCLPAVGEPAYLERMRALITAKGLGDNFLFVIERPEEFYAILQASTVFIRPTLTDGDAVSIREALHFGVPAVASDVCVRPEGTLLYRVGDIQDLHEKVVYAIEHQEELRAAIARLPEPDNFTPLLEIYRNLAAGRGGV